MDRKQVISFHEFFYENLAEDNFFEVADEMPFNLYYERPAVISEFPELKGKRVLDAGCAAGWYCNYLYSQGAKVTAVDISENMIAMCKKRMGNKIDIFKCDLSEGLGFLTSESFDMVLSSLALDYIEDWNFIMSEFHRVLKPQGVLIISVQHPFDRFSVRNIETYFETANVEHDCTEFGKSASVFFYKRPLSKMIMPIINNGFQISLLKEPVPTQKFGEVCPDLYNELLHRPEFLVLKAIRNG